jgi:regulator of RNase E activity RraA
MNNGETQNGPLPSPGIQLPITNGAFTRPDPALIQALHAVSSATASAVLHKLGIRQTFIEGPTSRTPGTKIVGPTLTLQFMPQREDIASGIQQEYSERQSALWHVFDSVQPGDVLCIDASADPYTGCLGEMLITYFKGKGGVGIIVDGYIRDYPKVEKIGVPMWTLGNTPNYASQAGLYPWAYNVPIACSRVLVLPGDIIIADDDGAVLVPQRVAAMMLEQTLDHEDWESFSRMRMAQGGSIWTYYPLSEEGRAEYEAYKIAQGND